MAGPKLERHLAEYLALPVVGARLPHRYHHRGHCAASSGMSRRPIQTKPATIDPAATTTAGTAMAARGPVESSPTNATGYSVTASDAVIHDDALSSGSSTACARSAGNTAAAVASISSH